IERDYPYQEFERLALLAVQHQADQNLRLIRYWNDFAEAAKAESAAASGAITAARLAESAKSRAVNDDADLLRAAQKDLTITGYLAVDELARLADQWKDLPRAAALLAQGSAFRKALEQPSILRHLDAQTVLDGRKIDLTAIRALCDRFNVMTSRDLKVLEISGKIYIYSEGYLRREFAKIDDGFESAMEAISPDIAQILRMCLEAQDGVLRPAVGHQDAHKILLRRTAASLIKKGAVQSAFERPIDALPSETDVNDFLASSQSRPTKIKTIYIPTNRDPEVLFETLQTIYESMRLYRWSGVTVKILDNKGWGSKSEDRQDYQAAIDVFCREQGIDPQSLRIEYVGPKTFRARLEARAEYLELMGAVEAAQDFRQVFLGDTVTVGAIRSAAQLLQGDEPYFFNDDDVEWRAMMPGGSVMRKEPFDLDPFTGRVATSAYVILGAERSRRHSVFVTTDMIGAAGQIGLPIDLIPRQEAEKNELMMNPEGRGYLESWRATVSGDFVNVATVFKQIRQTGNPDITQVTTKGLLQESAAVLHYLGVGTGDCFAMDPRYCAQAPINLNQPYHEDGQGSLLQMFFPRIMPGPRRELSSAAYYHNRHPSGRSPSGRNPLMHAYMIWAPVYIFNYLNRLDLDQHDSLKWETDPAKRRALLIERLSLLAQTDEGQVPSTQRTRLVLDQLGHGSDIQDRYAYLKGMLSKMKRPPLLSILLHPRRFLDSRRQAQAIEREYPYEVFEAQVLERIQRLAEQNLRLIRHWDEFAKAAKAEASAAQGARLASSVDLEAPKDKPNPGAWWWALPWTADAQDAHKDLEKGLMIRSLSAVGIRYAPAWRSLMSAAIFLRSYKVIGCSFMDRWSEYYRQSGDKASREGFAA
ncbi:MAG: hypothetical protein WCG06_03625, partial [Candidatus Omnitrophota bacterium]